MFGLATANSKDITGRTNVHGDPEKKRGGKQHGTKDESGMSFPGGQENENSSADDKQMKAEENVKIIFEELDELDREVKPLEEKVKMLAEKINSTELWARTINEDIKRSENDKYSLDELTEITEKRISLNETLSKATEARVEVNEIRGLIVKVYDKIRSRIYYRIDDIYCTCSEETKYQIEQRREKYSKTDTDNIKHLVENYAYIGRNVNTIQENIKTVRSDAKRIMPTLSSNERGIWESRLNICNEHAAKLDNDFFEYRQNAWLKEECHYEKYRGKDFS